MGIEQYIIKAQNLLRELVRIPSVTFNEGPKADYLCSYLEKEGIDFERRAGNNIICRAISNPSKPTLMLCAHIDTVSPSDQYSFDPYNPPYSDTTIYGLGSNDDGASVVSMLHVFEYFKEHPAEFEALNVNLCLVLSCEEERSGNGGMASLQDFVKDEIAFAIVGEPTSMQAAIAERGLLVIDAYAEGVAGHAAHGNGVNAIYKALEDIEKIGRFHYPRVSRTMGDIRLSVTQIEAGTAHNVIPDKCHFVIDVRLTDAYLPEEALEVLQKELTSKLVPRSLKNKASISPLAEGYPKLEGIETFISGTTSDWVRMPVPAFKMGPGDTTRSHKKDEFVLCSEIAGGMTKYIDIIKQIKL